jgi:polysaccharide export outer membrane protein
VITREGMLMFPEVGPVSVAGLTFQELRDQIQNIVANQLLGQSANITLGALRSINVFVLGEAAQPGSYTVSSLSTMTNALFASGGVTRIGSLRNIRLMRSGELVTELDLYDLLLRGDTSGDSRLLPGDVIFIPPVGKTVGIAGEVRRPAIYELKDETSPADILGLSGGLNPTAFPSASRIERISNNGDRIIVNVDLSPGSAPDPVLNDGDVIQVYSVLDQLENVVMLEGHVHRPGSSQWREGLRISDVLSSVDQMLPNPDLDYALIARETQPTRRIELLYVNLGAAISNNGSADDLVLQPRDQLLTFGASLSRQAQVADLLTRLRAQASFENPPLIVNVSGNVRFPGEYPLVRNMTWHHCRASHRAGRHDLANPRTHYAART